MLKKKSSFIIVFAIIIVFFAIKYFIPSKEKVVVNVVFPPSLIASLPHWVALENNYYQEAGISINPYEVNDSKLMIGAIYSKDADFLPAVSLSDVINTSSNKAVKPIIFSHSRMTLNPSFEALLVSFNSSIKNYKDLENKRIGVYPGVTSEATVKKFLEDHNVDIGTIKISQLAPPEHMKMLQNGQIDCSHSYEPFKSMMLSDNNAKPLSPSLYASFNEPSAIGVSVISPYFVDEHPEIAEKLLAVWDKAVDFIENHEAEARKILKQKLKLTQQVAENAVWVNVTKVEDFSKSTLKSTIESYKTIGLIDANFNLTKSYYLPRHRD
jgi:NitT/TauT family transport system substrate-binding protein